MSNRTAGARRGGEAERPGIDQGKPPSRAMAVDDRSGAADRRERQRDEFGGVNWGSSFFGWLVATGMGTILVALLTAAGAAIGLTSASASDVKHSAGTISIVGGGLLIVVVLLAYYCGGYVAGRMSRFDGGRQGFGVWLIGLIITLVLAIAGAVFGSKYNVLTQLHLPRIPIDEGSLATGGAIALAIIVLGTLLAAISGGKFGWRYHTKVDRAGPNDRGPYGQ